MDNPTPTINNNNKEEIKLVRDRTHNLANTQLIQGSDINNLKDQVINLVANDKISNDRIHNHDLLIERIDSALRVLDAKIPATLSVDLVTLSLGMKNLVSEFETFKVETNNIYVTKMELEPIRKIVYGMVGLILTAFGIGLVALVINK